MAYKKRVSYCFDREFPLYCYGINHNMQPQRVHMIHALILAYKIDENLKIIVSLVLHFHCFFQCPKAANFEDLTKWHSSDYISFLRDVTPQTAAKYMSQLQKYNLLDDCPVFPSLYDYCRISCGSSLTAALELSNGNADICINWMGGLHHAAENRASGFCYTNDIVLAILQLLQCFHRVLYVDIDGDAVEDAFYDTDRVMTCSFHQYGDNFFPCTGDLEDIGEGVGKHYSVNVPLKPGIDDNTYHSIFLPIMTNVMERFRPNVIVLQSGADSMGGDSLGALNLSTKGHGKCLQFLKNYNLPILLLGGYTLTNVTRCWTYETALAVDQVLSKKIPFNYYYKEFGPDFNLHTKSRYSRNMNKPEYLEKIKMDVLESLRHVDCAPSVQMRAAVSLTNLDKQSLGCENSNPDVRLPVEIRDKIIVDAGEFYDDISKEGDNKNCQSFAFISSTVNMENKLSAQPAEFLYRY